MSTRARLITTQTAVVCILVAVVYAVFLTPNGDGPLTGIEAPVAPNPQHKPDKRKPAAKKDGGGAGPEAPLIVPPAPPADSFVPPAPPDVEYSDSVAQLRTLLRAAEQ